MFRRLFVFLWVPFAAAAGSASGAAPIRHPLQPPLECRVHSNPYVTADLFYVPDTGAEKRLATYGSSDPGGACELAIRSSRNGVICIAQNYEVKSIKILDQSTTGTYGSENTSNYSRCFAATNTDHLGVRPGQSLDFIDPARLAPFKAALPQIDDVEMQAVLNDPTTVWYDELSMIFTYQDSQGNPQGLRANRVGYDVGINTDNDEIRKLVNFFEPSHFKPPFKTAFGTTLTPEKNIYLLNFWRLPQVGGAAVPVKYWREGTRWRWTFPVGTVFGEVMMMRAPDDGTWHTFEIRTRKRYGGGWAVAAFRPFLKASDFTAAVHAASLQRPQSTDLAEFVAQLESTTALERHTLTAAPIYAKSVAPIVGALDYIPETRDYALIKQLLHTTVFKSAEGSVWKEGGGLETYAASTKAPFSIVPQNYEAGVIPVNEVACSSCHNQTGRLVGDLDDSAILYGEIWGEDQIFTWHLFEVTYDAFTVSDEGRHVNPRLTQARLIEQGKPSSSDTRYAKPLEPVRSVGAP